MTLASGNPAPVYKRIIAGLIDYAFLWLVLWWPVHILVFGDLDGEIAMTRSGIGTHFTLIRNLVLWLFPFCLRDIFGGRGLGKWIVGIRVVDPANMSAPAPLGKLILRNVTIWLSPVGMIWAALDPDRMRFGDRLAGTMVVDETYHPGSSTVRRRLLKAVILVAAVGACWLSIKRGLTSYMIRSEPYEVAAAWIDGYEPVQQIIQPLSARDMVAAPYGYRVTADNAIAAMAYYHQGDNVVVALGVATTRDTMDPTWRVEDAWGEIRLNQTDAASERVFLLHLRRDLHRFLTDDEIRKTRDEKQPPSQVIPELMETDNQTTAPVPGPGEKAKTRPQAGE